MTQRRLESVVGYGLSDTSGVRQFPVIDGVIYTDLFSGDATTVTVDGFEVTGVRFNGIQGSEYNNEIRVKEQKCKDETLVDVDASWGDIEFEADAEGLIDYIGANGTGSAGIRSKKIEDFSVTVASGEETINDFWSFVNLNWGFLIRRPFIIDVAPERTRDDYLSF